MTGIALVPSWDSPLQTSTGLFALGDGRSIPGGWDFRKQGTYDPRAIPTPFARAEAMRLELDRIAEPGTRELADQFRWLLLGVASGVLELAPDDLKDARYDNLGRALLQVEPDARYFAHVRWTANERRSYGVTYFSSLFSPHARRVSADWNQLSEALRDAEPRTLQLLVQWRAALERGRRWDPSQRGCEWQRGVDYVLRDTQLDDSTAMLRDHARLVGPVWLAVPSGESDDPVRTEPVYLPAYARDWGRQFLAACRARPVRAPDEDLKLVDAANVTIATVRVPRSASDADDIAMGAGTLNLLTPIRETAGEFALATRPGQTGLVELLAPVVSALKARGRAVDAVAVGSCPVLYPDPIRLLVQNHLWPDKHGAHVARSQRLTNALIAAGGGFDPARIEASGGIAVPLASGATSFLVDRLGTTDVLDLRALGYALWLAFTGDAEISGELGNQLAIAETAEKLMVHSAERPLEPREWLYARVTGAAPDSIGRRVATLSRLLVAYPESPLAWPRAAAAAARAFVTWASGGTALPPLGRPPGRYLSYRLATGDELALAVDPLES